MDLIETLDTLSDRVEQALQAREVVQTLYQSPNGPESLSKASYKQVSVLLSVAGKLDEYLPRFPLRRGGRRLQDAMDQALHLRNATNAIATIDLRQMRPSGAGRGGGGGEGL